MLSVYWFCFAIGGAFVLLAILSGGDLADFGDHAFDWHLDDDMEITDPGGQSSTSAFSPPPASWEVFADIPKSFKFWTFALCFFGITGLVLSHLSVGLAPGLIAIVATIMGILCGTLVAGSLRLLRRRQVDSLVRSEDLVGLTGTVEVPFDHTTRGKVRLRVKGSMIDLIANTDETKPLQTGDRILVVGTEQNRLWVVAANGENPTPPL